MYLYITCYFFFCVLMQNMSCLLCYLCTLYLNILNPSNMQCNFYKNILDIQFRHTESQVKPAAFEIWAKKNYSSNMFNGFVYEYKD